MDICGCEHVKQRIRLKNHTPNQTLKTNIIISNNIFSAQDIIVTAYPRTMTQYELLLVITIQNMKEVTKLLVLDDYRRLYE